MPNRHRAYAPPLLTFDFCPASNGLFLCWAPAAFPHLGLRGVLVMPETLPLLGKGFAARLMTLDFAAPLPRKRPLATYPDVHRVGFFWDGFWHLLCARTLDVGGASIGVSKRDVRSKGNTASGASLRRAAVRLAASN